MLELRTTEHNMSKGIKLPESASLELAKSGKLHKMLDSDSNGQLKSLDSNFKLKSAESKQSPKAK